ncbi:MAG: response regulator [Candidatus Omnitrophota bacterium]|nr:response regulator [Candidatus Omnitrophota bacterium]
MPDNKVVMIIDDDKLNLSMLKDVFEKNGYSTITAEDGNEALEKINSNKVDFVLLDLILPGLDGLSFLAVVKDSAATKDIPVLVLTSRDSEETREEVVKLGAVDCLIKQKTSPAEVYNMVTELMAG